MPRRYTSTRKRRSRSNTENRRRRTVFMRPGVQITILLLAALIIFIILQSAGN